MTPDVHNRHVLAIESAIDGGSLSLFCDGAEVASRIGAAGVSRAEDLLVDIDDLLRTNGLSPRDLHIVAASAGPGSFTGIRIGLATAMGLARGAGAQFASAPLLHACASAQLESGLGTIALPVGRGSIAIQDFSRTPAGVSAVSAARVVQADEFFDTHGSDSGLVLYHSLHVPANHAGPVSFIGPDLARCVGLFCAADPVVTEPIFLSKQ
jgi:tRNA threonylcarbamoyl adenosine modification protein YeaZ